MGVIRVEHNKNYTTMANFHLQDKRLSLRAVGLMSKMLSLPEDWDYTVAGLAAQCKEGREAVRKVLQELEAAGYLIREQTRRSGSFATSNYTLYEHPQPEAAGASPVPGNLGDGASPVPGNPVPGNSVPHFPSQQNNEEQKDENKIPPIAPQGAGEGKALHWKPERFEAFWRYYPAIPDGNGHGRRPAKDRAIRAWDKLRPDEDEIAAMGRALKTLKQSRQWREGVGIPYASTWLNSRAWRDETEDLPTPARLPAHAAGEEEIEWV